MNDVIVLGHGAFHIGEQITRQVMEDGIHIEVDGEQVGTILLVMPPLELDPRERHQLEGTNRAPFIGAIGAVATA